MDNTFLIDKNDLGFDKGFCHKVIRKRHKFLIENNLPRITFTNIFPKSYCPINFLNNINDEIYAHIDNKIVNKISEVYNINANDLEHNICYYVENNLHETNICENIDHCNYSYGYLILLNEKTCYEGGDVYINDKIVNLDNQILFFKLQDRLVITNILEGEQHKMIGFVNYCFNENNDIISSFNSKKLNILKTQNYITKIDDILIKDNCVHLYKKLLDEKSIWLEDNEYSKKYIVLRDETEIMKYNSLFSSQFELVKNLLSSFNINYKNMLPIKICKYENIKKLLSFTPIMKDEKYNSVMYEDIDTAMITNTYIKFTLFICINDVKGKIIFPNQNFEFDLYNGAGFIIPNHYIYSFYITILEKNIVNDSVCFVELSFF